VGNTVCGDHLLMNFQEMRSGGGGRISSKAGEKRGGGGARVPVRSRFLGLLERSEEGTGTWGGV